MLPPCCVQGTDLVGDLPHAPGVVRALLHWLRPGGTALMVNAIDTHRFGIPRLKELLREVRRVSRPPRPGTACLRRDWLGSPQPHLRRDWAHPWPTSAPGLGSSHLRRG